MSSSEPRPNRQRERTRRALLDAAVAEFRENGVEATTIDRICERADVAARTFFNHFETRGALYAAITDRRLTEFAEVVTTYAEDPRPFAAKLPELFQLIGSTVAASPAYRELVSEMTQVRSGRSPISRESSVGIAARALIATSIERGDVPAELPVDVLADLIVGAIVVAITSWSADEGYDLTRELKLSAETLVDLLAPR